MKPYNVTLITTAKLFIQVDADNEDDAIDIAYDMLDESEATFGEWEVQDVEIEYDR